MSGGDYAGQQQPSSSSSSSRRDRDKSRHDGVGQPMTDMTASMMELGDSDFLAAGEKLKANI